MKRLQLANYNAKHFDWQVFGQVASARRSRCYVLSLPIRFVTKALRLVPAGSDRAAWVWTTVSARSRLKQHLRDASGLPAPQFPNS